MVPHAGQQRGGELDQHRVVVEALLEKPVRSGQAVARVQIIFEEDLQDDLSSSTASRHGNQRVGKKGNGPWSTAQGNGHASRLAISSAASAHSLPLLPTLPPAR